MHGSAKTGCVVVTGSVATVVTAHWKPNQSCGAWGGADPWGNTHPVAGRAEARRIVLGAHPRSSEADADVGAPATTLQRRARIACGCIYARLCM